MNKNTKQRKAQTEGKWQPRKSTRPKVTASADWVKPEDIPPKRVTIEDLETMLASKEPLDIEIQPDGSIRAVPKGTAVNADVKPITMKYAVAEYY